MIKKKNIGIDAFLFENKNLKRTLWDKSLETGIDAIDLQHKRLYFIAISILNHQGDNKEKVIRDAFVFLDLYTLEHFAFEEGLMEKYEYEYYEKHRKSHLAIRTHLKALKEEFSFRGYSDGFEKRMDYFMVKIFGSMVTYDDFKFADFLKEEMKTNTFLSSFLKKIADKFRK